MRRFRVILFLSIIYLLCISILNISNKTIIYIAKNNYLDANDNSLIISDKYNIDNEKLIISNIEIGTTSAMFINQISSTENAALELLDNNNHPIDNNDIVKTGYSLNTINNRFKLSVKGDVLGVGNLTFNGAKMIAQHIIDGGVFNDEFLLSADYNGDGLVKINDVLEIIKKINSQYLELNYSVDEENKSFTPILNNADGITYSISSQKEKNTDVTYFSITNENNPTLTIEAYTPVGTYNVVIREKSIEENIYNDIFMTVNITPLSAKALCTKLKNKNIDHLDYKFFIDGLQSNEDDYYAIKHTHDCANAYNLPVDVTKGTYNIYKKVANKTKNEIINKTETSAISIKTNTNLNDSTIYIHDEEGIVNNLEHKNYLTDYIFKIENDECTTLDSSVYNNLKLNSGENNLESINIFATDESRIDLQDGSLITVTNNNKKVFIRSGTLGNSGENAKDVFRVDNTGKILDPLFWNYDNTDNEENNNITNIRICSIPKTSLTFKNGHIYNIVDLNEYSPTEIYSTYGTYARRSLMVTRSNTVIDNIDHEYIDVNKNNVDQIYYRYQGFFYINSTSNIKLRNLKVHALGVHEKNADTILSTYDLNYNTVANLEITSVNMYDYDGTEDYYNRDNQLNKLLWGVTGTNHSKNVTYDNCVLNRIDSHTGVYNLTIKNTVLGKSSNSDMSISQVGFGTMNIENVTMRYNNTFMSLRHDYGTFWNGKINISNCKIIPDNNDNVYLIRAYVAYDKEKENGVTVGYLHNYGYDYYLPDININGLKIESDASKFYVFNNYTNYKVDGILGDGDFEKAKEYVRIGENIAFRYPLNENIIIKGVSSNNSQLKIANYSNDFLDFNGNSVNIGSSLSDTSNPTVGNSNVTYYLWYN